MNNTNFQDRYTLVAPDAEVMSAAKRLMDNHVVSLKLEFLPSMAEKLPHLQIVLGTAESIFRDKVADILARLNTTDLSPVDSAQQRVDANTTMTPEQKQSAIKVLNGQRKRIVAGVIASIESGATAIARSTDDLSQINLDLTDSSLRNVLQRQLDELTQRDNDFNLRLNEITADRRALDEAIKALEKYTVLDHLKENLPTAEELVALGAGTPDVALIQAGLDRLAKILDKVNSALTYRDLTEQRDKLRARYNELLDASRNLRKEIRQLADKMDEITALASVQQNKAVWAQESRKLHRSLYDFLDAHDHEDRMDPAFSHSLTRLKTYIRSIADVRRTL